MGRLHVIKGLFASAVFFISVSVLAASVPAPDDVLARIHREGGKAVLADLWEHDAEFEMVMRGIESANPRWLEVAQLLKPYSDAGLSESINMAVARALPLDPERVLRLIGHGFELDLVCTSPFDEPDVGVAEAYESKTLAALASLRDPDLKSIAAQCAERVKLPPAAG